MDDYEFELKELANIYEKRGLDPNLAKQVAEQLMAYDALGAHARDELGLVESVRARPIQAALFSAGTFTVGVALPLLVAWNVSSIQLIPAEAVSTHIFLATIVMMSSSRFIEPASIID